MIITELYQLLFGKNHLRDGDVIEMAEHGRAGGVSTGQGFKVIDKIKYQIQLDDVTTANVTYVGTAPIGAATSAASWQIRKVDESGTPITLKVLFADGNDNFDNVFDNRASLTYS